MRYRSPAGEYPAEYCRGHSQLVHDCLRQLLQRRGRGMGLRLRGYEKKPGRHIPLVLDFSVRHTVKPDLDEGEMPCLEEFPVSEPNVNIGFPSL